MSYCDCFEQRNKEHCSSYRCTYVPQIFQFAAIRLNIYGEESLEPGYCSIAIVRSASFCNIHILGSRTKTLCPIPTSSPSVGRGSSEIGHYRVRKAIINVLPGRHLPRVMRSLGRETQLRPLCGITERHLPIRLPVRSNHRVPTSSKPLQRLQSQRAQAQRTTPDGKIPLCRRHPRPLGSPSPCQAMGWRVCHLA